MRTNLLKIYCFKFFVQCYFITGVLIPFFRDWGGISFTQIMLLQAWFFFWIFTLEIPTGTIADRLGRKHSMILACVALNFAALVFSAAPDFYVFLAGEWLWAVGFALLSGADDAMLYDTLLASEQAHHSKKAYGKSEGFGLAGVLISAPLGSFIAARWGFAAPVRFMIIPFTIALVIAFTLKEPHSGEGRGMKNYARIFKAGLAFFYHHKILKILALDMILIDTIAFFIIWLHQPMLIRAGIPIAYFGLVFSVMIAAQIGVMTNFERFEKMVGSKKRFLFISALLPGIGFIVGGMFNVAPFVLAAIIISGAFGLSRPVLFVNYMNKYIPSAERATILSAVSMGRKGGMILAFPIVGWLVDHSLPFTLVLLGGLAIAFALLSRVTENHLLD